MTHYRKTHDVEIGTPGYVIRVLIDGDPMDGYDARVLVVDDRLAEHADLPARLKRHDEVGVTPDDALAKMTAWLGQQLAATPD